MSVSKTVNQTIIGKLIWEREDLPTCLLPATEKKPEEVNSQWFLSLGNLSLIEVANPLERRRIALKGRITSTRNSVDAHEFVPLTQVAATILLEKIDKLIADNDGLYGEIVEACANPADIPPHSLIHNEEDARLEMMKILVTEALQAFLPPTPSTVSAAASLTGPSSSLRQDIRLPRLELPSFSGNRLDWLSFHDLFRAAVHNNAQLSGAQKLQYLKAAAKGEAAMLIQAFPLTDDNYDEAWKTLEDRYQDKRELINQTFDRLMSLPSLPSENPLQLQKMFDRAKESIRAVDILHIPKDAAYELLLIHLLSKRLDPESRLQWERSLKKDNLPTLEEFCDFGDHQARVTGAARSSTGTKKLQGHPKGTMVHHGFTKSSSSPSKASCYCCSDTHYLYQCSKFKAMSVEARWKLIKSKQLCFNCLSPGHRTESCRSSHCRHCPKHHHSLLHGGESAPKPIIEGQLPPPAPGTTVSLFATSDRKKGLLSTALIRIKDRSGAYQLCRALLDNGSESSFVTSSCATRLGLRRQKVQVPLSGLAGAEAGTSRELVELSFSSCHGYDPVFKVYALILKSITRDLPSSTVPRISWSHVEGLELADPQFQEVSKIDVLLGADIFYELLESGKKVGQPGEPIAIKTALGWILGGSLGGNRPDNPVSTFMVQCNLDSSLQKFWELEELPRKKMLTPEEKACEEHFATTHSRDDTGRFIVRLPLKQSASALGESRYMAVRQFKTGERKNLADPIRMKSYTDVMEGYLQLGHMELIPEGEVHTAVHTFYMPHHAVENSSSSTTPFRVVFNASQASSSGLSLNKIMMVGPKLQEDLFYILVRFLKNKIAFIADIPKMYRQIKTHPDDNDLQRIVWRRSPKDPVRDYRLLTATFGTAAAPYLAIKSVQQLAEYEKKDFPEAAAIVQRDFYVDDLMSGASSEEEAVHLQQDLMKLLERGGLSLTKWASNSSTLMASLAPDLREPSTQLPIEEDNSVKTLGLQWHPAADYFSFRVSMSSRSSWTKRAVLSEIAKVFDPLGWLSPVTINAKIFMQKMWKEDLGWDQPLPEHLQHRWLSYREQMPIIENLQIPRFISQEQPIVQELHGFCDASEAAFAAVVFLRTITTHGAVGVRIVAAKSKVAPVKQVSLPRLELCGAVLLIRLLHHVKDSLHISLDGMFGWTDSTIVLAWLSSSPHRWKTFVANRVSEIQDFLPRDGWRHVKSEENPADCASRGIPQADLANHTLWWRGPDWLSLTDVPLSTSTFTDSTDLEEKVGTATLHAVRKKEILLYRYSNLQKLLRISAYYLRAEDWMRAEKEGRLEHLPRSMTVATEEMTRALNIWIKYVQHLEFSEEIRCLQRKILVPTGSRLRKLSPFLDLEGILRVGGRLQRANIQSDRKHPIVLPKKHHLTTIIIAEQHDKDLHTGPQALLASLQQKYWILAGRDVVRHFVRKCVRCCRFRAQCLQQKMGELPASRVTQAFPFQRTGVDYAGPYSLLPRKGRGQRSFKTYIALFVCMGTRAIHLELVSDMTTEAFLAALRRFISRRGRPTDMFSDCGTNFVGAKNVLEEHLKLMTSSAHINRLQEDLAAESIVWHLNPPTGAHHGGIWESAVKSMKYHLNRVIGEAHLTTEEMQTLLAQVEAVLNSRPITELSSDPADLLPLTPGHFLIGRPLTALTEPDLTHLKEGHLSRWQRVQQMFQHFWNRWSTEYLSRLQPRNKWMTEKENLQVGTLVLVKDENLPPSKWSLGRIVATFPGKDNLVRVVTVKTQTTELKRPITKLCVIPT